MGPIRDVHPHIHRRPSTISSYTDRSIKFGVRSTRSWNELATFDYDYFRTTTSTTSLPSGFQWEAGRKKETSGRKSHRVFPQSSTCKYSIHQTQGLAMRHSSYYKLIKKGTIQVLNPRTRPVSINPRALMQVLIMGKSKKIRGTE